MGILQPDMKEECTRIKLLPKKPAQDIADPEPTIPEQTVDNELFGEEACLETSWEEDLWMAVSPAKSRVNTSESIQDQEEPNDNDAIYDIDVEVNEDLALPTGAVLIAANNIDEPTYSFPEESSEDAKDYWGLHTFNELDLHHAPAALVEGRNSDTDVDQIYNMDIVQYAIGESGIDGMLDHDDPTSFSQHLDNNTNNDHTTKSAKETMQPVGTTASFIQSANTLIKKEEISQPSPPPVYAKKSSPYALESKPVMKKKVGRPERTTPINITRLPSKGFDGLTHQQLKSLKHRRMRDLNNEASKKCRAKRKDKQTEDEQECTRLEERNVMLAERLQAMELKVAYWKTRCNVNVLSVNF
eukprot:GFUD01004594.1.p1 GENE.GFUD01004594.1~~GFUD01004594.1.p1  ORF type:complete len:357 (+),score=101.54 GFUD01004594.1:263-1333(+)